MRYLLCLVWVWCVAGCGVAQAQSVPLSPPVQAGIEGTWSPLPYDLLRAIRANQPQAGEVLLALAADPQREGHRQAVTALIENLADLSAEQITTYFKNALLLKTSLRPQYPEGFDVPARYSYHVRHGWEGFPKEVKLKTRTTHFIDDKPFGAVFDYQGPMATTGWLQTGKLDKGEHQASLQLDFEWEHRGRRGKGTVKSQAFPFRIVNANIPDDLEVRDKPEDDQLVQEHLPVRQVFEGPGEGNVQSWHSRGRDKENGPYEIRGPVWKLTRALPFALSYDVEIHVNGIEQPYKGDPIFVPANQTSQGYFIPYSPWEFVAKHKGVVPVKIVLVPSYVMALADPDIKAFYAGQLSFEELQITINRPQN